MWQNSKLQHPILNDLLTNTYYFGKVENVSHKSATKHVFTITYKM